MPNEPKFIHYVGHKIDSEVVTLKGLLKELISELKDAKGNNSGGKDGDMDDENKKK
ncbi:13762_t:CDS:2 [Entrophospora sp. SA101]|nr:13762_t:CDS:2 [Entrophospora sp. SA101]